MLSTLLTLALAAPSPQPRDVLPKSQGCRIESISTDGNKYVTHWHDKKSIEHLRAELKQLQRIQPKRSHYLVCV